MTEARAAIRAHVAATPGVHFNALVRAVDAAPGQVQYHVRRLERDGDVVSERHHGRTHYFEPGFDDWERTAVSLLRRETARDVMAHLLAEDGAAADATAEAVGVARSTLSYHVERLVDAGLIERRRPDRRVHLDPARPEETATLLVTVEPSLRDRLVDRFTRLIDGVLPDARD